MADAIRCGISVPKGIFLVGMPGCGKSLCAEATSACFGEPLLKMDMGNLMDKYVGNSEEKLRKAIKTAEAVAPCVLWIDEIEKGFSGIGGQSDVVTRMFGTFLTWMQNKESAVYVVATANNINGLPPELKRKGRFDEIFFVDLPNDSERKDIFNVHLEKKRQALRINQDCKDIIESTDGFNGADIEYVVNKSIEELFVEGAKRIDKDKVETIKNKKEHKIIETSEITITKKDILKVANNTICIAKSCKDDLKKMLGYLKGSSYINATSGVQLTDEIIDKKIKEL
jgi:SpoVK/Ycf46/Vps4 family AAA+-type ATPase